MALKPTTIKNNKGQALTETLVLLTTTGIFLLLLLRCLLVVIFTIALDAAAEDYFYCELAHKTGCRQRLEYRLQANQMRNVTVTTKKSLDKITLTVMATHFSSMMISREFDYAKFNEKF